MKYALYLFEVLKTQIGRVGVTGFLLALLLSGCSGTDQEPPSLRLWYNQPADATQPDDPNGWKDDPEWLKALPLGNGSLGAMVFGAVNRERIQLNEKSLWSGNPDDNDNPEAFGALGQIRQLLFNGRYREATELINRTQICQGAGSGHGNGASVPYGSFQTLGDLWIDFDQKGAFSDYLRELDLTTAVARVSYVQNGVHYHRQVFISHPARVMVARFTAYRPGQVSFTCTLNRPERFQTFAESDQLVMTGALADGKGGDGMKYLARLKAVDTGGAISCLDSVMQVKGADEVVLLLAAGTPAGAPPG